MRNDHRGRVGSRCAAFAASAAAAVRLRETFARTRAVVSGRQCGRGRASRAWRRGAVHAGDDCCAAGAQPRDIRGTSEACSSHAVVGVKPVCSCRVCGQLFSRLRATLVAANTWWHSSPCGECHHVVCAEQQAAAEPQSATQIAPGVRVTNEQVVTRGAPPNDETRPHAFAVSYYSSGTFRF